MKKISFLSLVALINAVFICFSCSNEENLSKSESESSIEQKFNLSKTSTVGHNIMLANMFNALKSNPIKVNGHLIDDEKALDDCINMFIDANKEICGVLTRSNEETFTDFRYLKTRISQNPALQNVGAQTRADADIKIPDYLNMFYNEFFKDDELDIDMLNNEILNVIKHVKKSYPNLTEEEEEGLYFVAGVTYNSAIYWQENADKWVDLLAQNPSVKTRGHWLWDGVTNGFKKWLKADSSGAMEVWVSNKIVGACSGGTALLAGAAVGSAVGAWENLPCWD